jgi:hypothetical protein
VKQNNKIITQRGKKVGTKNYIEKYFTAFTDSGANVFANVGWQLKEQTHGGKKVGIRYN